MAHFQARAGAMCAAVWAALVFAVLSAAGTPDIFYVTFSTTVAFEDGRIVLEINRTLAPLGVDRLWELLQANYYNQNSFFRVLPRFVVQFGISGDPAMTLAWDKPILDDPVLTSNTAGTIAYATAGPNTRTTQLFINYANNTHLDSLGFSPLGRVIKGMDVATHIFAEYAQIPSQENITYQGNAYLHANFPKLDYILSASYSTTLDDIAATHSIALFAGFALLTLLLVIVSVRLYGGLPGSTPPPQEVPLTQLGATADIAADDDPA